MPSTEQPLQNNSPEESSGNPTQMNLSWFDRINEANNGIFMTEKYIIRNLDIAYSIGRSADPCQNSVCLWPSSSDGFVYIPYSFSSDFGTYDIDLITASLLDIQDSTCIRFRPVTTETDYINFVSSTGCWATIGHVGGAQSVSLQISSCMWSGIVTHEVLHALGLQHEHVRLDRDDYVQVQWDNIQPSAKGNFEKTITYNQNLTAYDYYSIMHYTNTAFSIDGILPTLIPIPDNTIQLGQDFSMSDLDIVKINTLYNCGGGKKITQQITQTTTTTTTTTPTTTTTTTPTTTTTTPTTTTTITTTPTTTTTTPTTTTTTPTTTTTITTTPTTTTTTPTTSTTTPTTTTTTPTTTTTTTTTPTTTTTTPTTTTTTPTTTTTITTTPTTTTNTPTTTTTTPTTITTITTTPTTTTTTPTTTTTTPTTTTTIPTTPTTTTTTPTTTTTTPTTTTTTITTPTTTTTTPTTTTTTPTTKTTTLTTTKRTPSTTTTSTASTTRTTTTRSTTTTTPTTTRTTTATPTTTTLNVEPDSAILNGCGGNLTGSAGVFTSPNYPNTYTNNAYCHWNITTNAKFTLTFTDLSIEGYGINCFDKLRIYNGRNLNTLYQLKDLCGETLPSPITSYDNSMQILFISDFSAEWKGFRAVYKTV